MNYFGQHPQDVSLASSGANSITDVVNARAQFSDINSVLTDKKGRNSVDALPMSRIDARTNKLVDDWLAQRASGAQSSVGDNLNYLNPKYSGANGRGNGWGGDAFQAEAIRNGYVFGKGNAKHYHGTTAGLQKYRPGDFGVNLPGQTGVDPIMTASTGGTGQVQQMAAQYQQQMVAANQNIAQQMPQMFQQPMQNVGQQFGQIFQQSGHGSLQFHGIAPLDDRCADAKARVVIW